jgi:cytochrome c oxidase subunit I+III
LPNGNYSSRSIPAVESREPLWDQPGLAQDVDAGRYYLPGSATGGRETIMTSAVEARPQWLLRMPRAGWAPVIAAWFTAVFFFLLTFKLVLPAVVCGLIAIAAILHWAWELDPPANHPPVEIGGGVRLPVYATGPASHAWWAMVILMLVSASLYGCLLFSYLYLWTVSPQIWPHAAPKASYALAAAALLVLSSAAVAYASHRVKLHGDCRALLLAVPLLIAAVSVNFSAHRQLFPQESAYGALVHVVWSVDAFFAAVAVVMALFAVARGAAGQLDRNRRVTFDSARLFWHYTVAQGFVGLGMVYGFPLLVS